MMKRSLLVLVVAALLAVASASPASAAVVISELMYHPDSEEAGDQFVEIYNTSPSATVTLDNWCFDGVQFCFPPGATIGPEAYLVLASDPVRFEEDLRVTIQCLGWRNGPTRYLTRQDDLASTVISRRTVWVLPRQLIAGSPNPWKILTFAARAKPSSTEPLVRGRARSPVWAFCFRWAKRSLLEGCDTVFQDAVLARISTASAARNDVGAAQPTN